MKTLSVKEAAKILGVHPESLRRMVREGKYKADFIVGGRNEYRFIEDNLLSQVKAD